MPDGESALDSALGELTALGSERDRERLAALQDRLESARLRALVVGEAKRGKSTLINALLGRDVLPSGVTAGRVERFTARLDEVEVHGRDAVTVVKVSRPGCWPTSTPPRNRMRRGWPARSASSSTRCSRESCAPPRRPGSSARAGRGSTRSPWPPRRPGASSGARPSSTGWPRWTPDSPPS